MAIGSRGQPSRDLKEEKHLKISGNYSFDAAPSVVWERLLAPDVLRNCIPGCKEFVEVDDAHYRVSMSVGIGMIRGDYSADVELTDREQGSSLRMIVSGKGSGGTIRGDGRLSLSAANGGTAVALSGDAQVTGVVARVGQRLLSSASRKLMDQFFACLKSQIDGA